ncbi:DNA-binding protein P3A2-like isoform X1 [Crassostrea virginica]
MNMSYQVTSSGGSGISVGNMNAITINTQQIGHISSGMMSDDLSEPSSPDSSFDASDLLSSSVQDDVTAQLAAAGPIGVAAAAAIASGKKRKHPHHFETNPSKRKRQQTRLLRKLKATIDEYNTRIGQQAVVLCVTPGKMSQSINAFKVFGSQPLEGVMRNNKSMIVQELEQSLNEQAPPSQPDTSGLHELPPLNIDGIPTPVDKMTQAQLRNFIPEMLKYSTGRSKPGWGKEECRPHWWPDDLPWQNVRSDARTEEEKRKVSWTEALRAIVKNCYKHHGREDLLHVFNEDSSGPSAHPVPQPQAFAGTMVQTINNPDGTVSFIQIDTSPQSVVTLADGTQATVVHAIPNIGQQEATQAVQTLADVATHQELPHGLTAQPITMEMNPETGQVTTLPFSQGHQIFLADDSHIGGIVTIPVSMYQTITGATVSMTGSDHQHVQVAMTPISAAGATVANINDIVKVAGQSAEVTLEQNSSGS